MSSDNSEICEGLTKNNYICMNKTNSNYTIHINKSPITELISDSRIEVNDATTEISLTGTTSNHYFVADEKAHCSERWEDWFCVPNYHNNNKVNKFPETDTMSVGICYTSCPAGYAPDKINKCVLYDDAEDLLYNPLAIIAMLGTHLYINANENIKIANYNDIKDTIGIRGSYLNDLYRVNNNNKFMPKSVLVNISINDDVNTLPTQGTSTQERIIINIIKRFVNTGRNGGEMNGTIKSIKLVIKKAIEEFIKIYVKPHKHSKIRQSKMLAKIKDYSFDTEKLDKIFGKDKCDTSKFKNAIAYCYDISRTIFYSNDTTTIDNNIRDLFKFNADAIATASKEEQDTLIKIFKVSCYNCFNVNYDTFNEYLDGKFGEDTEPFIRKDRWVEYRYPDGFKKLEVDMDKLESVSSTNNKLNIPYYNNITYYDHQLLAEYSENTKSLIYIILILAIFIAVIVVVWGIYMLLLYVGNPKGILLSYIANFINYCGMFYTMITYYIVFFMSTYYYYFLCKYSRSNYIIINLFFKFLNFLIMFLVASYVLVILLELLNINYFKLLSNMNFKGDGNSIIPDGDYDKHINIYKYILSIYLIGIYVYSMYITRYGLTEKEYDILTNVDAQEVHSSNHLNNLFLQTHIGNILETFNSKYTTDELKKARDAYKEYVKNHPEPVATVPDANAGGIEGMLGTEGMLGDMFGMPATPATAATGAKPSKPATGAKPSKPAIPSYADLMQK